MLWHHTGLDIYILYIMQNGGNGKQFWLHKDAWLEI